MSEIDLEHRIARLERLVKLLATGSPSGRGSGAANRVAYWTDANTITGSASFTFDGSDVYAANKLGLGVTADAVLDVYQPQNGFGYKVTELASYASSGSQPIEVMYQARQTTTDNTQTTIFTYTVPDNTNAAAEAHVVALRTGGASGSAGDGSYYLRYCNVKNVSGTCTLIGASTGVVTLESQAGWDAAWDVSTNTIRLRVTGAASNNVSWLASIRVWPIAS